MNLRALLAERLEAALGQCLDAPAGSVPALMQPASKPEFGDYQANGVMAAAKRAGRNPRELAGEVIACARLDDLTEPPEVAGPGFINLRLKPDFLAAAVADDGNPVARSDAPQTVVVDYSCPNLAKEMHVGHLRSTIIGDAMARILDRLGHRVIRQNHVGDWGTQFGMLLTYMHEVGANSGELADLEQFYRAAKERFDADADFAERSRRTVVRLQAGDADTLAHWQRFIDVSLSHCQAVYDRLGVLLTPEDVRAESDYNDRLPAIVRTLAAKGLLSESDGAQCVFLDEFTGKDGKPLPVIVQKSDGGYLYATTDLAAVQFRAEELAADRVLYFTDARQSLHFRQIFAVAKAAGLAPESLSLEHRPFGAMLGADGKPFKPRSGEVVKLTELLDEAVLRARAQVTERNPELDGAAADRIAEAVGIGAVKYADLAKNRTSDYVFDWDQMLAFDGNTAPYLLYAYARLKSLFRRGEVDLEALTGTPELTEPAERALAVTLLRLQEVLEQVAAEALPHLLCAYLYDLATALSRFYEDCPVLSAPEPQRSGRLVLCRRAAAVLETGLGLLGLKTLERM